MINELAQALQQAVRGQVRCDPLYRQLYSTDASHYRVVPLGVVLPRDADDIAAVLDVAARFDAPVLPRGSGTSLSGQSVGAAIILDTSRHLDGILEICPEERWVRAQPGVVLDHLNARLRPHGLMVGPDPASSAAATLGGMLGNNSTGSHSIVYGMIADHTLALEVMLADGRRVRPGPGFAGLDTATTARLRALIDSLRPEIEARYPRTWRTVAGYDFNHLLAPDANLARLFVGSEGTLGIITEATLRLVPRPKQTRLVILPFDSLQAALGRVPLILETQPSAVELIDRFFLDLTRRVPAFASRLSFVEDDPRCLFVVEYAGESEAELSDAVQRLAARLQADGYRAARRELADTDAIANVWAVRKAGFGLLMSLRGDAKPLAFVDDAAVPVAHLAEYAAGVERICAEAGTAAAFYAHASAGCLHINPLINLKTETGILQMRTIAGQVARLAISLGGTTTGEHGEGLARSCFNAALFGPRLHQAFCEVKRMLDPGRRLNPGKIIDAPDMADPSLLRFNPGYRSAGAPERTHLSFAADGGFTGLVEMCNGQGTCRARGAGVMCPSFMATRDERHATRGRANALRAAISGQLPGGLESPEVYGSLDLCLACKACKSECPSAVDMAKLKAEFLAHYYARHGVPTRNRVFGHIARLNALGRLARPVTNWVLTSPATKGLLAASLGVHPARSMPRLAPQSFEHWFRGRPVMGAGQPEVVLWHDTFMNENDPHIGRAAVRVLEAMGLRVVLVPKVCCGRPLISKGLLPDARRNAEHNLRVLAPFAARGVPIVGCEPSCISALRDEYPDFFPGDARAQAVAVQACFIEEWVAQHADRLPASAFRTEKRQVLYHAHCHQRAVGDPAALGRFFDLIPGCQAVSAAAGCCGMAGSFGYETEHYDLSLQIGEDRLFPAVRASAPGVLLAASGTSCRQQILDGTGRPAQHPIEVLADALA